MQEAKKSHKLLYTKRREFDIQYLGDIMFHLRPPFSSVSFQLFYRLLVGFSYALCTSRRKGLQTALQTELELTMGTAMGTLRISLMMGKRSEALRGRRSAPELLTAVSFELALIRS